ncbi:MFS transporter [Burkholderia stabilis]|uniref:Inner membrane transport protein ynfM,MFS transport protein AraJ,Argininosuccinate lyase,multidrug resistance protein,Major Facilitator Superfamily n=1 Tax=Burkholderia stabilis TaxID=95485 RepID=A0AAJ5T2K4_9BURK|nr:MFS transporter [Burkholderia stabilis]VBB10439.1 Inner membrane transport protein ynfM,MFS transport protein AraJ,Argininosuccinate lyase,multidrug resistance protein,Major Facilitator Superfamily [Burkholderia stabilis]
MNDRTTRIAFFLCGFAAFLNLYSTQGILHELAAAFGVSAERAGQGVSATTTAVAIIAPFVGMLAARIERRTAISLAAMAVALPVVWSAHAASFASFLGARFAAGLVMPFVFALSIAYIGERFDRGTSAEISALFVAGTTLGGFAGRFATNLMTAMWGWRHALDVIAALCLVTGAAIYASLPASGAIARHAGDDADAGPSWRIVTRGPLLASFAIGACVLASQVATFTFVGLRLARAPFAFGTVEIGAIYAVFLVAVVVTPLAGRIARHRGPRMPGLVAAALAIGGALLTLSDSVPVILAGLALSSTAVFVEQASANTFISQAASTARSTAIGIYLSCYYFGGSLGSILPVPGWHRWGWAGCVAFVIVAQAIVGVLVFRFWRTGSAAGAGHADARGVRFTR